MARQNPWGATDVGPGNEAGSITIIPHPCNLQTNVMLQLDTATNKVRQSVKQLATKGDVKSARILAREVVRSNRQKDRLSVSKARLGSISNQLSQQLGENLFRFYCSVLMRESAMAKVTGSLQKSTEIMKLTNSLIRLPQINQTMREMSMEMTKVSGTHCRYHFLDASLPAGRSYGRDVGRHIGHGGGRRARRGSRC